MLNKFFVFPCALLGMLFACSSETEKDVAGGTEAESTIAIQIQYADGVPAARSRVRVLPETFLSNGLDSVSWLETDENGRIEIEKIDDGRYIVEARLVENAKALGAVAKFDYLSNAAATHDTLKLEELSVIEGSVTLGIGPSVVRIPGMDRFVIPDQSGRFVIDSLPPGNFGVLVESRSNRGSVTIQANAGEKMPEVNLGEARGFAVEDFESFSGLSGTGDILGDGWWYTLDVAGENLLPLWDETLAKTYSGSEGCASGGCARVYDGEKVGRLGFLLGLFKTDYVLPGLDTLMFSARGSGKLQVSLSYGDGGEQGGLTYDVELSKVWQGYAIALSDMKKYGKAKSSMEVVVSRIDFQVGKGDTLFLDDVFLGGIDEKSLDSAKIFDDWTTSFSKDWKDHDALLDQVVGYASGVRGGAGPVGESGNVGEICEVTTTEDYLIVEDTVVVDDSTTSINTNAVVAPGSLRECAMKDTAAWIVFKNSGTYNLQSPLRIKSNKTFDGRGRDIRITGMGILTDVTNNVIFENLTFAEPSVTVPDTSSRRAISIHNLSNYIWIDHCTFEEYPIVEIDIKRGSNNVTVSWCRFENAQTGILFGLTPDIFVDTAQTVSVHHSYFVNMDESAVFAHGGDIHAYNNYFKNLGNFAVACAYGSHCLVEKNVFDNADPVVLFRDWEDSEDDSVLGHVKMQGNWLLDGSSEMSGDADGYAPGYEVDFDVADAALAWLVKGRAGPR